MSTQKKFPKVLSIIVAALQIPLLMLWTITVDAFKTSASEIKYLEDSGFDLVFTWDKLGSAILSYGPILLALTACLVLTVMGLVFVLRQKQMTIPTVCFYAVTALACVFLCLAFAAPSIVVGEGNAYTLRLCEYVFYRYFGGMELRIIDIFPLLQTIKFFFLGLLMAGSGALCGLGIADWIRPKAMPTPMESELYEIVECPTEQN